MTVTVLKKINKTTGWTPERRAAQAARLRAARIWLKSTGPRSAAGKARSSRNAYKTGAYSAETRLVRAALRAQGRFRRRVALADRLIRQGGRITPTARDHLIAEGVGVCFLLDLALKQDIFSARRGGFLGKRH